jgi:hypothetical protein
MNRHRVAVTGALLGCLACGGSGGNNSPSISVTPATTTVTAGGGAVTFTGTLNNTTGTISWALAGPGSITPASGNATTYTPPASVAASTSATLTASAGAGLNASATITINPPAPISVSGMVVDVRFQKFSGVAVIIGSQSTLTDANGQFTITSVTPPYDLTALVTVTNGSKGASVFKGLTRTDPTIIVFLSPTVTENTGTVSGLVTGGDPPGTAGERALAAWGSQTSQAGVAPLTGNTYELLLSWDQGLPATTGTVHVLQWAVDANGLPASYKGYGVTSGVSVQSGGVTPNASVAMSAPGSTTVGGSITVAPGVTLRGTVAALNFDDGASFGLAGGTSPSFTYLFPNVSGATGTVSAGAQNAGGDSVTATMSGLGLSQATTNVSLAVPSPASAILPADVATGIGTTTDFSWTAVTGGNVVYMFQIFGPPGAPSYVVFTTATSARIPDLSAEGFGLASAQTYRWSVFAIGPHPSVDSAAGAKSYLPAGNTLVQSNASLRSFTTP